MDEIGDEAVVLHGPRQHVLLAFDGRAEVHDSGIEEPGQLDEAVDESQAHLVLRGPHVAGERGDRREEELARMAAAAEVGDEVGVVGEPARDVRLVVADRRLQDVVHPEEDHHDVDPAVEDRLQVPARRLAVPGPDVLLHALALHVAPALHLIAAVAERDEVHAADGVRQHVVIAPGIAEALLGDRVADQHHGIPRTDQRVVVPRRVGGADGDGQGDGQQKEEALHVA